MKTIAETLQDVNLDTMARLVMEDPNHRARAAARAQRARKCGKTQTERQLAAVLAQREKERANDRKRFEAQTTRMVLDHNATTAALVAAALAIGYILALL